MTLQRTTLLSLISYSSAQIFSFFQNYLVNGITEIARGRFGLTQATFCHLLPFSYSSIVITNQLV